MGKRGPIQIAVRLAKFSRPNVNGCVEWAGELTNKGYGELRVAGKHKTTHRLAWTEVHGPIPDGLWVLHKCDNRKCINVEHLYLGTVVENSRDMAERKRSGRYLMPESNLRGSAHGMAQTDETIVEIIRVLDSLGVFFQAQIGRWFGLKPSATHLICTGRNWPHVRGPFTRSVRPHEAI